MGEGLTLPVNPPVFLRALFDAAVASVQAHGCLPPFLPKAPKGRVIVLGAGKAAAAMAKTVEGHLQGALSGVVVVPDGYSVLCDRIEVLEASHPVPDERSMTAAQRILDAARAATAEDLVLCLISGGASSVMALPAPGISLDDKRAITSALLKSGAAIDEMNCVRKHLSAVKGGRLAAAASPARLLTLIVSDVVGDDPAVIASGPTVADPTTCEDALAVLTRYGIPVPAHIGAGLRAGALESPKNADNNEVRIVAKPGDALAAAQALAESQGFAVLNLGDRHAGDAAALAVDQAALVEAIANGRGPVKPPCIILSGGECVVTVRGSGRGGPNTEFALALAHRLNGRSNVWALAADTDGADGNARAAGAFVTPGTLAEALKAGIDVPARLRNNDSAGVFAAIGGLVTPGPTFTNVNDFRAILVLPGG